MDIITEDNAGRVILVDAPDTSTVPIPFSIDETSSYSIYLTGVVMPESVINSVSLSMGNDLFFYDIGWRRNPIVVSAIAFEKSELEDTDTGIASNTGPGVRIVYDFFRYNSGVDGDTVTLNYNGGGSSYSITCLLLSVPKCKWSSSKGGPFFTQFVMKLLPLSSSG